MALNGLIGEGGVNADFSATWSPRVLAVLRIVTALLFLEHATAKLFGFPHIAFFDNLQPFSLFWILWVVEPLHVMFTGRRFMDGFAKTQCVEVMAL